MHVWAVVSASAGFYALLESSPSFVDQRKASSVEPCAWRPRFLLSAVRFILAQFCWTEYSISLARHGVDETGSDVNVLQYAATITKA